MASKKVYTVMKRKRSPSRSVASNESSPEYSPNVAQVNKCSLSSKKSQVANLSPNKLHHKNDFVLLQSQKKLDSPVTSPCKNQGDVVTKQHDSSPAVVDRDDEETENANTETVAKKNGFMKLPRRSLIECPNDWEDIFPMDNLGICDNKSSAGSLSDIEDVDDDENEPPKSIDEMFNHIIHCLFSNESPSLKSSASMPGCFKTVECLNDNNMNHGNICISDDEFLDDEVDDPTDNSGGQEVLDTPSKDDPTDNSGGEEVLDTPSKDDPKSCIANMSQMLDDIDLHESSLFVNAAATSTNTDENDERCVEDSLNSKNQHHSLFDRARQLTRKAISNIRSRSPTPTDIRESLSNVVDAGKTFIHTSKDILLSSSCLAHEGDEDYNVLSDQEIIEMEFRSKVSDIGSCVNHENQEFVGCLDEDELKSRLPHQSEVNPNLPCESHENENAGHLCSHDIMHVSCHEGVVKRNNETHNEFVNPIIEIDNEKKETVQTFVSRNQVPLHDEETKCLDKEHPLDEALCSGGNLDIRNCTQGSFKIRKSQIIDNEPNSSNICYDTQLRKADGSVENKDCAEVDINEEVHKELYHQLTEGSFPLKDEGKIIFKSSMSDVPLEEVSESEDQPRKTISLVTSNECDQDRDITEVIALISEEVSLKRYPSVNDLTDLDKEGERSISLSLSSRERKRRNKLKEHDMINSGNLLTGDSKDKAEIKAIINDSDVGNAEIDNKQLVNVLDPSYDTDDDQRSSDLSSCDELSTRSSSQRQTTTSSLTTPPNSPKVGVQNETVGTIVSLFETTSILYASHSVDDELSHRLSNTTDYVPFVDDEDNGETGKYTADPVGSEECCLKGKGYRQVDEDLFENTQSSCDRDKIQGSVDDNEHMQLEKITLENENYKENSLTLKHDTEQLIASLPSPPNSSIQDGITSDRDGTTHGACTSTNVDTQEINGDLNIVLLREILQKEANPPIDSVTLDEPNSLPTRIEEQNIQSTNTSKSLPIKDKTVDMGNEDTTINKDPVLLQRNGLYGSANIALGCEHESVTVAQELSLPSVTSPRIKSNISQNEQNIQSTNTSKNLPIKDKTVDMGNEDTTINKDTVLLQPNGLYGSANIALGCEHESVTVAQELSLPSVTSPRIKSNISQPNCAEISNFEIDIENTSFKNVSEESSYKDKAILEKDTTSNLLTIELATNEISKVELNKLETQSVIDSNQDERETEKLESDFVKGALSSSFSIPSETNGIPKPPGTNCSILVPGDTFKRLPRPNKIVWALNDELIEPDESCSTSEVSDRDDESSDIEDHNKTQNRSNSCQPKQPATFQKSVIAARPSYEMKDCVLTGNSYKMAQFLLYTGALVSSESLNRDCNGGNKLKNAAIVDKALLKDSNEASVSKRNISCENKKINQNDNSYEMTPSQIEVDTERPVSRNVTPLPNKEKKSIYDESGGELAIPHPPSTVSKRPNDAFICQNLPSHPFLQSSSLDSAICKRNVCEQYYGPFLSQKASTPLSLLMAQNTPQAVRPDVSQITKTFENTCQIIDSVSQKIESNVLGISKATEYIDRAKVHLNCCDELIVRSRKTLNKSAEVSAKVRDQVNLVDQFLSSGKRAHQQL